MFFAKLWRSRAKAAPNAIPVQVMVGAVPTNTEREARENPAKILVEAMMAGSSGAAIEAQEARGQEEVIRSQVVPTDIRTEGGKIALEAAGMKFLGPVNGDELFQYVELPPGWKKVSMGNDFWTNLVDEKGRERGSIFYKAASYDRDAFMNLNVRFRISFDYDRFEKQGEGVANVYDFGKVVHTTTPILSKSSASTDRNAFYDEKSRAEVKSKRAAEDWLCSAGFADWTNPGAYWD